MRIRFQLEFFSYDLGSVYLISDEFDSKTTFEYFDIPYKNNKNQLVFGDFLQNRKGFIGFIYQVTGYIDFDIILPQFQILDCKNFVLEKSCKDCDQEDCIDNCCDESKSTKTRRHLTYITVNDTNFTVTSCPTYFYLVNGNQCV